MDYVAAVAQAIEESPEGIQPVLIAGSFRGLKPFDGLELIVFEAESSVGVVGVVAFDPTDLASSQRTEVRMLYVADSTKLGDVPLSDEIVVCPEMHKPFSGNMELLHFGPVWKEEKPSLLITMDPPEGVYHLGIYTFENAAEFWTVVTTALERGNELVKLA